MKSIFLIFIYVISFGIASFNCRGVNSSTAEIVELCDRHQLICIQEHWLPKQNLYELNNICENFRGIGSSPMDLSSGIITGRPFGGVGILWHQ